MQRTITGHSAIPEGATLKLWWCDRYGHHLSPDPLTVTATAGGDWTASLEVTGHAHSYVAEHLGTPKTFWVYPSMHDPATAQVIDLREEILPRNALDTYMHAPDDVMGANAEAVMGDIYCLRPVVSEEAQRLACQVSAFENGVDEDRGCRINRELEKIYHG